MKISEWSEGELSAWIAEKHEPRPLKGTHRTAEFYASRLKWWVIDDEKGSAKPRLYTDPEICLKLLKGLIGSRYGIADGFRRITNQMFTIARRECREFVSCDDLERAIAEAWALAHGIEAEHG